MGERISRHFTWEEMTYSRMAVENGLDNEPPYEVRLAMKQLVEKLLQPLRIAYALPIAMYLIPKCYWTCCLSVNCLLIRRFFINGKIFCICRLGQKGRIDIR